MHTNRPFDDGTTCVVCAVEVQPETAVSQVYMERILYFCSSGHLKEYMEEPDRYADLEEDDDE